MIKLRQALIIDNQSNKVTLRDQNDIQIATH